MVTVYGHYKYFTPSVRASAHSRNYVRKSENNWKQVPGNNLALTSLFHVTLLSDIWPWPRVHACAPGDRHSVIRPERSDGPRMRCVPSVRSSTIACTSVSYSLHQQINATGNLLCLHIAKPDRKTSRSCFNPGPTYSTLYQHSGNAGPTSFAS